MKHKTTTGATTAPEGEQETSQQKIEVGDKMKFNIESDTVICEEVSADGKSVKSKNGQWYDMKGTILIEKANNTEAAPKQDTGYTPGENELTAISKAAEDFYPFPDGNFSDEVYQDILKKRTAFENGAILCNEKLKEDKRELLEALKNCSYQLQTWAELDLWSDEDEKAYTEAEAAIAKAEGKKQINGIS